MKNIVTVLFLAIAMSSLSISCSPKLKHNIETPSPDTMPEGVVKNEILVLLKDGTDSKYLEAIFSTYNLKTKIQPKEDESRWIYTFDNSKIKADALMVRVYKNRRVKEVNFVEITKGFDGGELSN